jgi:hydrogenase nickel incorporation protein HypA/HybF
MAHVPVRCEAWWTPLEEAVHELSIAASILQRVGVEAERYPGARLSRVGVRIGELSGVDPDALAFGFEMLVKDTPWEPLHLDIEFCQRRQRCRTCGHEFTAVKFDTACPKCGETLTSCIGGDELDIAFIEVEDR